MAQSHDIIVVGAGLAGLAAARQLSEHGIDVLVLETADDVGGRVRTDEVDGLLLDRGFQLYNPAYPEAARVLDHAALDLQPFVPGVIAITPRGPVRLGDPRRRPRWAPDALTSASGSLAGKLRFARYAWRASRTSAGELANATDVSAEVTLRSAGIDDVLLETVLRPFLAGVFLEDRLATSRRFLDLVLTSFVRGIPSVPAAGMGAIPHQLHDRLPEGTVRLGSGVRSVDDGLVRTDEGELTARAIIVATDPPTAATLLPGLDVPEGRAVTTWYYVADGDPSLLTGGDAVLVVGGAGPVLNTVVLTHAARDYASGGRALVSASALGVRDDAASELEVRAQLAVMYGVSTQAWEPVRAYAIPYALPAMLPPLDIHRPVALSEWLFVAGDHRDTGSIQGAMVSGRRAADAARKAIGHRAAARRVDA